MRGKWPLLVIIAGAAVATSLRHVDASAPSLDTATCDGQRILPPTALVSCLRSGRTDLSGVTIDGDVDLTEIGTVLHPLRCVDCIFSGDLVIADVTFSRTVSLEGVLIEGDLDARGAHFAGPVVASGRRGDNPTGVRGTANFALAHFEQAVYLQGTTFADSVSFEGAQFDGAVTMSGTETRGSVTLDRIVVAGTFLLDGPDPLQSPDSHQPNAVAEKEVTLREATFEGDVDLGARRYLGGIVATGARVGGRLAMRNAIVVGQADLSRLSVTDLDVSGLRVAATGGPPCTRTEDSGPAELNLSDLRAETITLSHAVVDELALQGARITERADLNLEELTCDVTFDGMTAARLEVDLEALDKAGPSARVSMLQTIADTAGEAGDLKLANEATYRQLVERSKDDPPVVRQLNIVFYRGLAGYMVKPARPLAALLLLLLIGTMVRFLVLFRRRDAALASTTMTDRAGIALGEAGRAIIRPSPKLPPGSSVLTWSASGRLTEYLTAKVLLVILIIAISNNSKVFERIVDAL